MEIIIEEAKPANNGLTEYLFRLKGEELPRAFMERRFGVCFVLEEEVLRVKFRTYPTEKEETELNAAPDDGSILHRIYRKILAEHLYGISEQLNPYGQEIYEYFTCKSKYRLRLMFN